MTTIEKEIKNIIEEVIGGKYVGRLKVDIEDIPGEDPIRMLLLYLDMEQTPLVLAYQGSEDRFKEFIYEEMKARKLHAVHFWKAIQDYPGYKDGCEDDE